MKFPPGYGYQSREDWQRINAKNDPAHKMSVLDKIAFLLPFWALFLFGWTLWSIH